jgi:hypothetical protein
MGPPRKIIPAYLGEPLQPPLSLHEAIEHTPHATNGAKLAAAMQ